MKHHFVMHVWKYVIGLVVVAIIVIGAVAVSHKKTAIAVSPSSGPEGTVVTVTYPKPSTPLPSPLTVKFFDAGAHGYVAMNNGAATYVTYDTKTGLSYTAPAAPAAGVAGDTKHVSYTAAVPAGICGLVIQSAQDVPAPPKTLTVALVGPDGKEVPGGEGWFDLKCDKYTLKIKIVSSKDPVLPDGADNATVTATLSVTGPAQFVNGQRVKPGAPKIILTTPLGLVMTHFTTSLGTLVPNPANVKTDLAGQVSVTISSSDAGIARVRAIAEGIGDAYVDVHFPPKITAVQQVFVQPQSPTNYQITTIPANPKDLTIDWKFIPGPGLSCGGMTGPLTGAGLVTNGFYHGPSKSYPDGCPEQWEFASKVQVTVTDKDHQSDTKTFGARDFEGKGPVKL